MRTMKQRWSCLVIAWIVLIAGLAFNGVAIDPEYIYTASAAASDGQILSADPAVRDVHMCTSEMLGIRGNAGSSQSAVRQPGCVRRDMRISLDFFYQDLLFKEEDNVYSYQEQQQTVLHMQEELVAEYIHNSDGKKRIL